MGIKKRLKFRTRFEGAEVIVIFRPLSPQEVVAAKISTKAAATDREAQLGVLQLYSQWAKSHVVELRGLLDANGNPVSVVDMASQSYFSKLQIAIGEELLSSFSSGGNRRGR